MIFRDCNILQFRHANFFFGLQNPFLGVQNISPYGLSLCLKMVHLLGVQLEIRLIFKSTFLKQVTIKNRMISPFQPCFLQFAQAIVLF
jgi:hypothetical protein